MVALKMPPSRRYHALNFAEDPRVTSIHAAVVATEAETSATFTIAPRGETWRNSLDRCAAVHT
jgi:hypothetical protein